MGGKQLVAELGLAHGHRHLFLRHRRFFGAHAGDLFAGQIELDRVDAIFDERAHRAAHFFRAGDDDAEIEPLMWNVRGRGIAEAADRRDLRPCRAIARARDHAGVDRVADDDIEARLGCRGTAPSVKPASSTSLAICAVTSVCSSGGIIWIGSIPGALFQER